MKPLGDDRLRGYVSCLAQHRVEDLRGAFDELRRRGVCRVNPSMPHLFLIVQAVRRAYYQRTKGVRLTTRSLEAA